jgi:Uma2 family endonuclease
MSVVTVWDERGLRPDGGEWTVDDLANLPNDGMQYELFDGVLVVSPSPLAPHQRAAQAIYRLLYAACPPELEVFFAPFDFQPTNQRSLQPDVLVVRRADVNDEEPLHKPPLLVVEVLSKSTASKDQVFKREMYAKSQVPHFWIFDPRGEPSFVAYNLVDGAYEKTSFAVGDTAVDVELPYPVRICPAEIVEG